MVPMCWSQVTVALLGVTAVLGALVIPKPNNNLQDNGHHPKLPSSDVNSFQLPEDLAQRLVLTGIDLESVRRMWVVGMQDGFRSGTSATGKHPAPVHKRHASVKKRSPVWTIPNGVVNSEGKILVDDIEMTVEEFYNFARDVGGCVGDQVRRFDRMSDREANELLDDLGGNWDENRVNASPSVEAFWERNCYEWELNFIRYDREAEERSRAKTEENDDSSSSSSMPLAQTGYDMLSAVQSWAPGIAGGILSGAAGLAKMGNGGSGVLQQS